jgi:hypothetical protein
MAAGHGRRRQPRRARPERRRPAGAGGGSGGCLAERRTAATQDSLAHSPRTYAPVGHVFGLYPHRMVCNSGDSVLPRFEATPDQQAPPRAREAAVAPGATMNMKAEKRRSERELVGNDVTSSMYMTVCTAVYMAACSCVYRGVYYSTNIQPAVC